MWQDLQTCPLITTLLVSDRPWYLLTISLTNNLLSRTGDKWQNWTSTLKLDNLDAGIALLTITNNSLAQVWPQPGPDYSGGTDWDWPGLALVSLCCPILSLPDKFIWLGVDWECAGATRNVEVEVIGRNITPSTTDHQRQLNSTPSNCWAEE